MVKELRDVEFVIQLEKVYAIVENEQINVHFVNLCYGTYILEDVEGGPRSQINFLGPVLLKILDVLKICGENGYYLL